MCGIAGCVVRPGETPSLERLRAMRDALSHRGPDGSGVEVLDNVGLVHTRLAIVDVSERAHQPMRHPNGQSWISYNGEVFNYKTIRQELTGESLVSGGDTETLLHALVRWGPALLPRLNGQFAFAALDLGARRLLLARDCFGIKPLYLSVSEDGIWFASEIPALVAAGVKATPQPDGWSRIRDTSCYRGETTLVAGIRRLLPGTSLDIDIDTLQAETKSWDSAAGHVDPERQAQLQSCSRPALIRELSSTLRTAVHDTLLSDVPIGTLCSGGVDSSLITALASEVSRDLVAFGARYRGDRALDEGPAAQRLADALGIELESLDVTPPGWRSGFASATVHFGAPMATASAVTVMQMAERARARGVKVLLTGEGADELFAGYSANHVDPLYAFLSPRQRAVRQLEPLVLGHPLATSRVLSRRAKGLLGMLPGKSPGAVAIADADPSANPVAAPSDIDEAYRHHEGPRGALETNLLQDLDFTLSHLLNRMDKNMMQVSVEARVPFLDPRVVDLALNLPLEAKVTPWSKGILRDVARAVLPWRIAHRPKIYGMDFDAGAWIEEAADPRFLSGGVFQELYGVPSHEFAEVVAGARGALRVRLWSAEVWCRSVFTGESLATIEKDLWPHGA